MAKVTIEIEDDVFKTDSVTISTFIPEGQEDSPAAIVATRLEELLEDDCGKGDFYPTEITC